MELTGKYAFNSKVFVDGKQVDVTEIFKDRTELMASPEIQTESKKDNNKQVVEFKLPNINSKVELVTFDSNKPNEKIQATINLKNDLVNKSLDKSTLLKYDIKDNNINENKDNEKISTDKKLPQTGLPINTGILASMGTILSGLGIALRKKIKK
ncbi:hypothetical protein C3495_07145 [Clostridiaceae bacterium 14S0207]|nr:hypothetical protein C3495_07145 [Clostridiaceae bacterium 14S0207]